MEPIPAPAGWHPDPTGRFEFRYFNGERWTSDVSVHGQRFVDQVGPAAPQPGWVSGAPITRPPSRGFAVASFVVGLASLAIGWVPFVFVLGVAGAVTAIVFGFIALGRVRREQATGRSFAIAGMALSVAALGVSVLGFFLTRSVMREFDQFLDIGPHTAQIDSCVTTDGLVTLDGSITNDDDVTHTYTIVVSYSADGDVLETDEKTVRSVAPGETATFHATAFVTGERVQCAIDAVNGPNPFTPNP